jgi:hypothetical protein
MKIISNRWRFVYAYLAEKDVNKSVGKIAIHILYDTQEMTDDGIKPVTTKFLVETTLPTDGICVNPIYAPSTSNYLRDIWLKKTPLWCVAHVVQLLETACNKKIFGNNQHCEGTLKYI